MLLYMLKVGVKNMVPFLVLQKTGGILKLKKTTRFVIRFSKIHSPVWSIYSQTITSWQVHFSNIGTVLCTYTCDKASDCCRSKNFHFLNFHFLIDNFHFFTIFFLIDCFLSNIAVLLKSACVRACLFAYTWLCVRVGACICMRSLICETCTCAKFKLSKFEGVPKRNWGNAVKFNIIYQNINAWLIYVSVCPQMFVCVRCPHVRICASLCACACVYTHTYVQICIQNVQGCAAACQCTHTHTHMCGSFS